MNESAEAIPTGDDGPRTWKWQGPISLRENMPVDQQLFSDSQVAPLPLPEYPPLKPYIAAEKDLLAKNNTLEFNPKKGEELLTPKDWKKDSAKIWTDPQGGKLRLDIIGFGASGPVLIELLKRPGVDATLSLERGNDKAPPLFPRSRPRRPVLAFRPPRYRVTPPSLTVL